MDDEDEADEEVADQEEGRKDEEDEAQEPVVEQLQVPADIIKRETCYAERWQNATRYAEKALYKVLTTSIVPVITEELRMSDVRSSVVCTSNKGYILHSLPSTAMGNLVDAFFLQCGSICAAICDNQMSIIRIPDCDFGWEAPNTILMSSRPKMFHTTIECWYRTNLNKSKGTKAKIRNEEDSTDIIDERGYVDGVKMARKCSKANVLGKAVEYIRVFKKREMRLKREQDGLKALPEWREKFGGEEKDEVDALDIDLPESDEDKSEGYA
ncbi:hypothetical protein IW262DRAFT_1529130 [Armillaria fumosa]|nr:hypothetical protein IW262DRAFT_1529130 [Armillaria fumosa]